MKYIKFLSPVVLVIFLSSCISVRVVSDYDKEASFAEYKSFAFYKPGIDKAKVSDIDKKRIMRNLNEVLVSKGFTKSNQPDILVSFFTKEHERINVYNNSFGIGWGWHPWYFGGAYQSNVTSTTQGVLYVDIIDSKTKSLIWQGKGSGSLNFASRIDKKEARINEFVTEILAQYPPKAIASN